MADALERVPGRVLVTGHTDDQALKSFRYRDNFELSRERALSVLNILKPAIRDPGASGIDRRRIVTAEVPTDVHVRESGAESTRGDHPRAGVVRHACLPC